MRWMFCVIAFVACCPSLPARKDFSVTVAGSSTAPAPAKVSASPHNVAPVTVAIVVDQFAGWVARARLPLLPSDGGFARLREEGTWYQDVRYAHAITDTAPGHASLYTGKVPREHGIVTNEFWTADHTRAVVADETTHVVSVDGVRPELGSSLRALTGELVADRFKAKVPSARVYSFSLKDRGALPGGGRHPDVSLWFDAKLGQFISSTGITEKLPGWVLPALGQESLKIRIEKVWMPSARNESARMQPETVDDQPGEGDFAGYGAKFPHQPSHSTQPFAAFRANPESDKMLLELGVLALENTPSDVPVLLAISLSANDYIGHLFGPDSWEAIDELVRLDYSLAWFFDQLDKLRGPQHWNVVLSADHGVVPLPEVSRAAAKVSHELADQCERPTEVTNRVPATAITDAAKAGARTLGSGNFIAAFVDPYLYLTDEATKLPKERASKLRASVTKELSRVPCVEAVFATADMPESCPPNSDESLQALVCRSIQPGKGGEYYVALKPGCFYDTGYVLGFGTSHGNAELADRSVPVMVRAPGKVASGKIEGAAHSFELFSQLLLGLLGANE